MVVKELTIKIDAWRKMMMFARVAAPKEIIGYLYGEETKEGLLITDIILPKQEVTACTCNMLIDKTITDIEKPENIKGIWHSHHTMGAFLSGPDKDVINNFGADSVIACLSLVISLPNTVKAWVKYFKPIEIEAVEIPYSVLWNDESDLQEKCETLFKEKVSEKKWLPTANMAQATGGVTEATTVIMQTTGSQATAEDWNKGELGGGRRFVAAVVEDLQCPKRQMGRKGPYCEIFGKPFICGTTLCKKYRGDSKTASPATADGAKQFQGCDSSFNCATIKDGIQGCIYVDEFVPCIDCGLDKIAKSSYENEMT